MAERSAFTEHDVEKTMEDVAIVINTMKELRAKFKAKQLPNPSALPGLHTLVARDVQIVVVNAQRLEKDLEVVFGFADAEGDLADEDDK